MDRYIGDMITDQRFDTQNEDTDAISNDHFLRYNQYAQHQLYGRVTNGYSWLFEKTITTSIVADQAEYDVNDNLAFGTRITNVEYAHPGSTKFFPLEVTLDRYRTLAYTGKPYFYRRRHGTVVIEPVPTTSEGTLRITYERAMDKLALRSAQISGTPSSTDIALSSPTTTEEAKYTANTFVCVSDVNGTPMLYNGVISSYDAGTDTITLTANVEDYLVTGYSLSDLANAYITLGKYTTTHSAFPNEAEGYFNEYVVLKVNGVEDSEQFSKTLKHLSDQASTIIQAMKIPDKARKRFPVDDHDALLSEY